MLKPGSHILEGSTSVNQKSPDVQHSCHHPDSYRGWSDSFNNFLKETPTEPRNLLRLYNQR